MSATLRELADNFGCELHGTADKVVTRVATLAGAAGDAVTFLANPLYRAQLANTRAAAVILEERYRDECPVACLVNPQPYLTYARIAAFLHPPLPPVPGVHATAVVAADVQVPASAQISAQVVIGSGCALGESVVIGAGSVIGSNVTIGRATRLAARVTVLDGVRIGERCLLHPGVVIGADGFGFAQGPGAWVKVPQLGSVVIGDDVEIGVNTAVDRGTIDNTVIEDGVKLDNLVQIAHNVRVGAHTVMAAMSGIAGSTKVGKRCMIGGGVVMIHQLDICDDVMFTFRSVVTRSVKVPGTYSGSLPAEEAAQWRRNAARFKNLDALAERLRAVERTLKTNNRSTREKEEDDD
ncbi:MAG TPA: UDP-3-O-(3-hydroxymyristoyl)glucosamine N-acyltransferase [Gammaproteobacteria bacterium]|nr:UDP-3-O-(3-hydroxymyristoyl)glucosamine N-acyltransferase [Gammaproteobacteria bacterium]